MFTVSWNHWSRLRWTLLAIVLLSAAALSFVYRHRPAEKHVDQFQVPPADKMAADSANRKSSGVVPEGQLMTLDPTGKFLINSITKKAVFITGDAAWSLQGQLSDPDIQMYLSDRASRGFNSIIVDLAENYYSNAPPKDFYGNVPFNGADFTNENPAYWARVDQTISWAAARGITVLADPAFVGYGCKEGYCESYRKSSADVLAAYGQFLGNRYKGFPNIIWLIGGDADFADSDVQSKLYSLAKAIRSADKAHLMTTESYRGTSSEDVWSEAPWLDLDGAYLKPSDVLAKTSKGSRNGKRPMFMLEDWYEGTYSITEPEERKEAYWAVLNGCTLGRVFGNFAIWNFTWAHETKEPWKNQLGSIGSLAQASLGRLFRSREHWKIVPDLNHTVLTAGYDPRAFWSATKQSIRRWIYRAPEQMGNTAAVAGRTSDGQTIIAFIPVGDTVTVDMSKISDPASEAKCWWFNPRDGSNTLIGTYATAGVRKFTPPDTNDWVLVIDSNSANLAPPGSMDL